MRLTKARINKAIAHTGLQVYGEGGAGYFYFADTKTNSTRGINVNANRLNHLSLDQWVRGAEEASRSRITEGFEEPDYDALIARYGF
jgi:hypothetical protein